jgi:hypothetical protein
MPSPAASVIPNEVVCFGLPALTLTIHLVADSVYGGGVIAARRTYRFLYREIAGITGANRFATFCYCLWIPLFHESWYHVVTNSIYWIILCRLAIAQELECLHQLVPVAWLVLAIVDAIQRPGPPRAPLPVGSSGLGAVLLGALLRISVRYIEGFAARVGASIPLILGLLDLRDVGAGNVDVGAHRMGFAVGQGILLIVSWLRPV